MPKLRTDCPYCRRPFTAAEMAERRKAQRDNALRSREKAAANGKRVGRKRRADVSRVAQLRAQGKSIRACAAELGVSHSSIYQAIQAAGGSRER